MNIAEAQSLPLREKFQILEVIWADLNSRIDSAPISQSERTLLDSRIERVESGAAAVHDWDDWDDVKHSIGNR